jgi:hypothetical protein
MHLPQSRDEGFFQWLGAREMKNSETDFAEVEFQTKEGDDFVFGNRQPASVTTTRAGDFHSRPMGRSPIQPPSSSVDAH